MRTELKQFQIVRFQRSGLLTLLQVQNGPDIDLARELFREYQRSLDIDLCFQDFEHELAALPGEYAPPSGRLILSYEEENLAGCVALRMIDKATCKMKRLYVRPGFRGKQIGKRLAEAVIEEALRIGYAKMKLDTLPTMTAAIGLYTDLGFKLTPPYRHTPHPGALYMELDLVPPSRRPSPY